MFESEGVIKVTKYGLTREIDFEVNQKHESILVSNLTRKIKSKVLVPYGIEIGVGEFAE